MENENGPVDASPETVERAAVRVTGTWPYIGTQTLVFEVPRPLRHDGAILAACAALRVPDLGRHEQGFVTSTGRFVLRDEAAGIATRAKQVQGEVSWLTTEHVW